MYASHPLFVWHSTLKYMCRRAGVRHLIPPSDFPPTFLDNPLRHMCPASGFQASWSATSRWSSATTPTWSTSRAPSTSSSATCP